MVNDLRGNRMTRDQIKESFGERAANLRDVAGAGYAIAYALMEVADRMDAKTAEIARAADAVRTVQVREAL